MGLASLTTMNSKVKVHVVDGSKCVRDCGPTEMSPCRGGRRSLVVLGILSGFWREKNELGQNFETGAKVPRAGRDTQISRGQGAEPSGSWGGCGKFPRSLVTSAGVAFSGCTARLRAGELKSTHDGVWRRAEEGDRQLCRVRLEALVGLSCLHLQQSQHGRVVSEFHPPLGGQADVLSQVVYSS